MNHGTDVGSLCLFLMVKKKTKTSSLANTRLQPKREEVIGNSSSQKEIFEILLELLPSCFSVIVSLTGGGGLHPRLSFS